MLSLPLHYPVTTVATLVCLLGLSKGGAAEKGGALLVLTAVFGTLAAQAATRQNIPLLPLLAIDFSLSCGFLWLALKHSNLWLGSAMIIQAAELGLHALFLSDDNPGDGFHAVLLTVISWLLLACLLVGTLVSWRKRARGRRTGPTPPALAHPLS